MKTIGFPLRLLTTLAAVAAAVFVGLGLWNYYMEAPRETATGAVRADVVMRRRAMSAGLVPAGVGRGQSAW